ncbi:MAG: tRNA lysidine(34) synthetase TilS [Fretibacterium sp.]|nr:tRNA lysidine(34) synthetase TilS [Fretibacterium sp.]
MADRREDRDSLYRSAWGRLTPFERERERGRDIPYPLSLHSLAKRLERVGRRQGWLPPSGPVLAAVSGGGDSMALLWLLRTFYAGPVVAAHVNHGIRGAESDEDARFVRQAALGWGVEFREARVDVPGGARKGESLESAARRMRYEALSDLAEECGACGVALGHNREDVAETVLFNLLRGTGVRGSVGMPERRGIFFRPLLSLGREFLRDILRCRGFCWREDRSNEDLRHTRNFLRHSLLPLVEERVNERAVEHLAAFAEEMRAYREDEERRGTELLAAAGVEESGLPAGIARSRLAGLPDSDRVLLIRALARRLGLTALSRVRSLELARLLEGRERFSFAWGGGITVCGDARRVTWARSAAPRPEGGGLCRKS